MIERPRHIVRCDLHPDPGTPGGARSAPVGPFPHDVRFIVDIDARQYPLQEHCRYARWRDPAGPATFTNLEFAPEPPGMRVGPWPGWRGIPDVPQITLSWAKETRTAVVHWWGDELDRGFLRAAAWFPPDCAGEIQCVIGDPRLHAVGVSIVQDAPVRATKRDVRVLPAVRAMHPRLLMTREDLDALRGRARSSHRAHMGRIHALLAAPPLPAEVTPESKTVPGPERLRPEDRALLSAFAALVEPSHERSCAALAATRAFVAETRRPDFEPWGIDTQSGEMLFLLCVLYDWLYDLMDPNERTELRAWLWNGVGMVRRHLDPERTDLAQAHYLGCGLGLLAFACLFSEEHPDAAAWLGECAGAFATVMTMLPADGFHPHGANLWIYEYGFLLRWLEILRVCTGEDHWHLPHWKNASAFRGATMSPDALRGITFGDPQYHVGGDAWCHFLIAARTGSGRAKATGDVLVDGPHEGIDFRSVPPRRRVYEFLFDDPAVVPDRQAPAVEHFADGGQVMIRTGKDRSGLFTFKAGPPIGQARYGAGERGGYGHADPCNGSFLWYAQGRSLVAGPGPVYRRDSSLHNIVTINGKGQIGDGTVWLPEYFPPYTLAARPAVVMDGEAVTFSVDLFRNYLPHLGIRRCFRALHCDPVHERIVGIDVVECAARASIEWNLHSSLPFVPGTAGATRTFHVGEGAGSMTGFLLEPEESDLTTGPTAFVPAYPHDGTRDHALRWSREGTSARFVWCLSREYDPAPPAVRCYQGVVDLVFGDGTRLYFDGSRTRNGGGR